MNAQAPRILRTETGYRLGDLEATGLTPRESQVLLLRAKGNSIAACAAALCCSQGNVRQITNTLFYKLRVNSAPALICKAFECKHLRALNLAAALLIGICANWFMDTGQIARAQRTRTSSHLRIQRTRNNKEESSC